MFQITELQLLHSIAEFRPDGRPIDTARERWKSLPTDAKSSSILQIQKIIKGALIRLARPSSYRRRVL
jgi:hypothetical protein